MSFDLHDEKGKSKGVIDLKNCSLRNFHTFLDLHLKNGLNLVPIIAVDYSLANLTFDEAQYCIHTLKPGAPNDYISALRRFSKTFRHFSKFMLGFGLGARTVGSGEGPACNLFSMTGDFMDPFVGSEEELFNSYCGTLKTVKLGLPVCFKDVFKLVCDLAQMEFGTASEIKQIKNYFVLTILMAGCIDDFQDALN
jgi:Copine